MPAGTQASVIVKQIISIRQQGLGAGRLRVMRTDAHGEVRSICRDRVTNGVKRLAAPRSMAGVRDGEDFVFAVETPGVGVSALLIAERGAQLADEESGGGGFVSVMLARL